MIEIPDFLLPDTTAADDDATVWVRVVPRVHTAHKVTVETLSSSDDDDWTRLQRYADWLEDGGFLRQVSLVYHQQDISLRLPDDDAIVTVRVRHVNDEEDSTVWPRRKDEYDTKNDSDCHRIVANTELILLPPTAAAADDNTMSSFRVKPAREDFCESMERLYTRLDGSSSPSLVSCARGSVVLNPRNWPSGNPYGSVSMVEDSSSAEPGRLKSCMVRVQISDSVPKDCIGKSVFLSVEFVSR